MKLLPQKLNSKKVLDIGCGVGAYTYILGMKGAKITAIDISPEMIKISKEKCTKINVNFLNISFQKYDPDPPHKFDLIIGGFMLGYFDDLLCAFEKIFSLLENSGSCILSMIHPIKLSSLSREDGKYLLDNYFDENSMYKSDLSFEKEEIFLKKWTFADIAEAAYKAGLFLDRILEPTPYNPPLNFDEHLLNFYHRCPSVLVVKLKKRRKNA